MKPDLSIIIPTKDRPEYLFEAIKSCKEIQNIVVEIIVINNGQPIDISTDAQVVYLTSTEENPNTARNIGLRHSNGTFIKFLDDDDYLIPENVFAQYQFMISTNANVSYGNWYMHDTRENVDAKRFIQKEQIANPLIALLNHWSCGIFSYMFRKSILKDIWWDETLKGYQDFDFVLKIAENNENFAFLDLPIGYWRLHNQPSVMKNNSIDRVLSLVKLIENSEKRVNFKLSKDIKNAFAQAYYRAVRPLIKFKSPKAKTIIKRIYQLQKHFIPNNYHPLWMRLMTYLFGIEGFENILTLRRQILKSDK